MAMAMRRDEGVQDDLIAVWSEIQRSLGHAFYDKLQKLLRDAGFDAFVEDSCNQSLSRLSEQFLANDKCFSAGFFRQRAPWGWV